MLEFDEAVEIFVVDGVDPRAPATAPDQPRPCIMGIATIRAAAQQYSLSPQVGPEACFGWTNHTALALVWLC